MVCSNSDWAVIIPILHRIGKFQLREVDFEFLGGLVIYSSYQVKRTTYLKSFHFLCTHPRKDSSAWTEVWSISWPSTAPIMAPGGRDLGDF